MPPVAAAQAAACVRRFGGQRHAQRELVRRGEHRPGRAGQVRGQRAALVYRQRPDGQAVGGDDLAVVPVPVLLHRERAVARRPLGQDLGQQGQGLGEAGADHDLVGCGPHAADPSQIAGQLLAQLGPSARVGVAQRRGRRRAEGAPRGGQPRRGGEERQVGHAGHQAVPGPVGRVLAGPGGPAAPAGVAITRSATQVPEPWPATSQPSATSWP